MESLYGGRPGTPFIIKRSFKTVDEMDAEFAKGAGYTGVLYGEYCIIDTVNKNDKNNGTIYRRGYTAPEYIGQIIGPKGGLPNLKVTTLDDTAEYLQSSLFIDDTNSVRPESFRNYPTFDKKTGELKTNWIDDDGEKRDKGYSLSEEYFKKQDYRKEGLVSDVAIQDFTKQNQSLVPGKEVLADGKVKYNDSIRWNYCNVRLTVDENGNPVEDDFDGWMYIGFEFPYNVFEFEGRKVEHWRDARIDEKDESKDHNYFWSYLVDIPKGRPGQDLVNVYIDEYDPVIKHANIPKIKENIEFPKEGRKIWLCTLRSYVNEDDTHGPEETTYYICPCEDYHGQDVVSVYIDEYDPDEKHAGVKKINQQVDFPEKGKKAWFCVLRDYDVESKLLGIKPLETVYYISPYEGYHGQDVVRVWKEKCGSTPTDTITWPDNSSFTIPDIGTWIWLIELKNYDVQSELLGTAPETKIYYVGKDTSILIHKMWKEKYVGNDMTSDGRIINWPHDANFSKPVVGTWIWLYQTKDSIDDTEPIVYYAGVDTNITNTFEYDFDSIIPGTKSPEEYLKDLNAQDNSEYAANSILAYSYEGIIYFFAFDGSEWVYAGTLGSKKTVIECEEILQDELGFLGSIDMTPATPDFVTIYRPAPGEPSNKFWVQVEDDDTVYMHVLDSNGFSWIE